MTILYDPKAMNHLYDELHTNGSTLKQQNDHLQDLAKQFQTALIGQQGNEAFARAHTNWDNDFQDTLQKLDALGAEVENALHRALDADGKVGDGFAGF